MTENDEPKAAELLAASLLTGLAAVDVPLARRVPWEPLLEACRPLGHLRWTPLMIQTWATHPRWAGVQPDEVLDTLRGLGHPPEASRTAVVLRPDRCPEHPDADFRGRTCDQCAAERTDGPPAAFKAARRGEAPAVPEVRCERTELLVGQCSHCLGQDATAATAASGLEVTWTIQARRPGRCALDARHPIEVDDRIGKTDHGWICSPCCRTAART
jgi:hypothetical protein